MKFDLPNNRTLKVIQDDYCSDSPREWTNITKMIFFGNHSHLGDKHNLNSSDYGGWDEMEKAIIKEFKPVHIQKVYGYSHSGLTISTSPFSCPWDSGVLGFVIVTKEDIRTCISGKRVMQKHIEQAISQVESEVEILDQYIRGDVYGFEILDEDENVEDSCWGFYGDDILTNGILDHISDEDREVINKQLLVT